ncbi:hypothetical protein MJO29_015422 [Puccinia striiformis f. sp. tritici]|nr:hypothetical protein Pst134EB_029699 [Puccinia striiformis f. sp. tritici]KAI7936119.1 hypothetical protein MJO29_015422 [Puccinia striiformis f. sp. tritici]
MRFHTCLVLLLPLALLSANLISGKPMPPKSRTSKSGAQGSETADIQDSRADIVSNVESSIQKAKDEEGVKPDYMDVCNNCSNLYQQRLHKHVVVDGTDVKWCTICHPFN